MNNIYVKRRILKSVFFMNLVNSAITGYQKNNSVIFAGLNLDCLTWCLMPNFITINKQDDFFKSSCLLYIEKLLFNNFIYNAGTDCMSAFSDSESHTFFNCYGSDKFNFHNNVITGHYHLTFKFN